MEERRCPECGYRLTSNRCPICSTYVPFGAAPKASKPTPTSREAWEDPQPRETWKAAPRQPRKKKGKGVRSTLMRVILIVLAVWLVLNVALPLVGYLVFRAEIEESYENVPIETEEFIPAESAEAVKLPAIESAEIFNADGVVVTANALGTLEYGDCAISLTIANNSGKDICVSADEVSVNGYMLVVSGLYCQLEAGETREEYVELLSDELAEAGIDTVANVTFLLRIYDDEYYMDIGQPGLVSLDTSAAGDVVQPVDDSGIEVYNNGSVRLVFRWAEVDGWGDCTASFFLENISDQAICIESEYIDINGYTTDGSVWCILRPDTRCIDEVYFYDTDFLDTTADLEDMTMTLTIHDWDTWELITETAPIIIDLTGQGY